jgi:hypothetical protein
MEFLSHSNLLLGKYLQVDCWHYVEVGLLPTFQRYSNMNTVNFSSTSEKESIACEPK